MGRSDQHTPAMKHLAILLPVLLLLSSCYKDDVDIAALNNNPFDRDYVGENVFVFEETFLETVNIGGTNVLYQVIVFRVREELFLSPASYSVRLDDLENGLDDQPVSPESPGSSRYRYRREPLPGQSICLSLSLANNQSYARPETICATL